MAAKAVALDAVGLVRAARRRDEDDGAVRQQAIRREQADIADDVQPEAATAALERDRRVEVAVADHPRPARSGRRDDVGHQLRAAGREQQRLGARADSPVAVVEHERPHALAERRAARLAALHDLVSGRAKTLRQQAGLRRLADAIETFERDEHSRERLKGLGPTCRISFWCRTPNTSSGSTREPSASPARPAPRGVSHTGSSSRWRPRVWQSPSLS
jgi:hypothetical protein